MSELVYQDQSAGDLQLTVVDGPLDRQLFHVVKTVEIVHGLAKVEASIIGASHLVSFNIGATQMHEVFACMNVETDSKRAYYGPLSLVQGSVHLSFRDFNYSFEANLKELNAGGISYLEDIEAAAMEDPSCGLIFEFPQHDDSLLTPKTIVAIDKRDDGIGMTTAHSYPKENQVVFTTSSLKFRQ